MVPYISRVQNIGSHTDSVKYTVLRQCGAVSGPNRATSVQRFGMRCSVKRQRHCLEPESSSMKELIRQTYYTGVGNMSNASSAEIARMHLWREQRDPSYSTTPRPLYQLRGTNSSRWEERICTGTEIKEALVGLLYWD